MSIEYKYQVMELWQELGDVPINPDTEEIEVEWHSFPAGTHREKIWHWFEKTFQVSVGRDLMYEKPEYTFIEEILFRAKEKKSGEWINGLLSRPAVREEGVVTDYYFNKLEGYMQTTVKASTIGRSSGKRDINHRKIFQGDFIKSQLCGMVMLVKYGQYQVFCPEDKVYMESIGFYASSKDCPDMPLGPTECYAEVIGNISDNPELFWKI